MAGPALAKGKPPGGGGGGGSTTAFKPGVQLLTPPNTIYGITQAEPSLRAGADGQLYVAAPAANVIGCEFWRVSATDLTDQTFTPSPDLGVGGGDCDLAVTPTIPAGQSHPTISYSSLYLANFVVAKSTDGGATWTNPPNATGSDWVGDDRQWMANGGGDLVYMSYHIVTSNNIQVEKSTDGGATFHVTTFPVPTTPGSGQAIDAAHLPQALMNNTLGPIVVDMSSTAATKPVYTIFTAPHSAQENVASGYGSTSTVNRDVYLASSYDGGVTWTDSVIYTGGSTRTFDHIFPALAIDSSGGFWAAWASDEQHIYVTHAPPAAGNTVGPWTKPLRVDTGPGLANVFPWIVGGGSGWADLVWYAGTSTDPTKTNMDPTNSWNVRMAQLNWAKKGGVAVTSNVVASDHAVRNGVICTTGVACSPTGTDRNLLDFFQVDLTPDGRAAIAWADDHATPGAQIYVTVQCSGVNAKTGSALTSTC
jgi:hypothetical protein